MDTLAERVLSTLQETTQYLEPVKSVLDKMVAYCRESTGRDNRWTIGERTFFFEWPEHGETEDGSVVGDVFEQVGAISRRVGDYHITGEGEIVEFPFVPEEIQRSIEHEGIRV